MLWVGGVIYAEGRRGEGAVLEGVIIILHQEGTLYDYWRYYFGWGYRSWVGD